METQRDLKSFSVWLSENFPEAEFHQNTLNAMRYTYEQAQTETLIYVMSNTTYTAGTL